MKTGRNVNFCWTKTKCMYNQLRILDDNGIKINYVFSMTILDDKNQIASYRFENATQTETFQQ